jgi:uncharacterized protein
MSSSTSLVASFARRVGTAVRPDVTVSPPPRGVHVDWNVPVRLRDGVTLRLNVFRPESDGRFPVVMSAHPYDKDKIPARTRSGRGINFQYRLFPQPRPVRLSAWTGWEAPDPAFWVPRGYAVVNADLRGGGASEGTAALFSDQEAEDYYELIEWAGGQPWSSGRVGLAGVSYLAISQYKVAALRPPHLAAICPWEGFTDLYRDFARPGGVLESGFSSIWSTLTRKKARVAGNLRRELARRPERDEWYAALTPRLEQIEVPMLVCGSFSDHSLQTRGSFEAFRRAGSARKWLYTHRDGKWSHFYGATASSTQADFFDHLLKEQDNGWDTRAPVRLAVHEAGPDPAEIRDEQAWPPPDLDWTCLHLDLEHAVLSAHPPAARSSASFATRRRGPGVALTWTVPHDLDVIGPLALRLFVETRGCDDVHLFVGVRKLRGEAEIGFEGSLGFAADLVTSGWQRAAFRDLDASLSTPTQPVHTFTAPRPLSAGEIVPVDIELRPQATRFRRGELLRLDIRGTWLHPRNPVTGQPPFRYAASPKGTCILHAGGEHAARLLLGLRPLQCVLPPSPKLGPNV